AGLLVLLLRDGVAAQVVEQDLAPRVPVVLDVARQAVQVVEATPRVPVHLHQPHVSGGGGERRQLVALLHELAPAALLPRRGEHDLPEERLIRRGPPVRSPRARARAPPRRAGPPP